MTRSTAQAVWESHAGGARAGDIVGARWTLPRILGVLFVIGRTAYVIGAFTTIAFPDQRQLLSPVVTPLYFGEVPAIFWRLIRGEKGAPATAAP